MAGNTNSGNRTSRGQQKDKPYRDALRMEIAAAGTADDPHKALREVAKAHLRAGRNGDMQAIKEMADRLDGKPAQEAEATIHHTYEKIVREIVYPEDKDGADLPTAH